MVNRFSPGLRQMHPLTPEFQLRFSLRPGDLAVVDRTGKQFVRLSSEAEIEFWQELVRLRNLLASYERNEHNVSGPQSKRNPHHAPRTANVGAMGS
jgi:hypothetical protein